MAELTPLERLQSSLLDRLTDDEPEKRSESRDQRVFSIRRLRESVLRDLGWLLNTTNAASYLDAPRYPEVVRSTLNFGIRDLAGVTASNIDRNELTRDLREAVLMFEPRILGDTVEVDLAVNQELMSQNTISLSIEGELWAVPVPLHLLVNASLDLETGAFVVAEQGRGG